VVALGDHGGDRCLGPDPYALVPLPPGARAAPQALAPGGAVEPASPAPRSSGGGAAEYRLV
jgi:hypothetical protein